MVQARTLLFSLPSVVEIALMVLFSLLPTLPMPLTVLCSLPSDVVAVRIVLFLLMTAVLAAMTLVVLLSAFAEPLSGPSPLLLWILKISTGTHR